MIKLSPDVFQAAPGDVIRITVQSVNFVNNAQLDPKLTTVKATDFLRVGEITMGDADVAFVISYGYPDPLPEGGKYRRTITGGGFTDGPYDVVAAGGLVVVPYTLHSSAVAGSPARREEIELESGGRGIESRGFDSVTTSNSGKAPVGRISRIRKSRTRSGPVTPSKDLPRPVRGAGDSEWGSASPASPAGNSPREIRVIAHNLDGSSATWFDTGQQYMLLFSVGAPVLQNLASGNKVVSHVPVGGLRTHWVVTSANVDFVSPLSTAKLRKIGDTWLAEFDFLIPEVGESDTQIVGITAGAIPGKILVTIYAISARRDRELYREVSVDLAGQPVVVVDEICRDPLQAHLATTHEWTTPGEHIQISIKNGVADVSTKRVRLELHEFMEQFSATDTLINGAIKNVRDSLERLREKHGDYMENVDAGDLSSRLAAGQWKPDSGYKDGNWEPLPDGADQAHKAAFDQVRASDEWRALASDGYALYERCFAQRTELRALLDKMVPGSRIDFHWTDQSGPGWVPHVPWALMYMEPVDVSGGIPPPAEKFLGLRFRIATRSWRVNNGSVAMGDLETTSAMDLLYWGTKAGDDVAEEARWQASEYRKWKWSKLLPDPSLPDLKRQLVQALDRPLPAPVGVLYIYCHCSVGSGAQPCLRFGNTSKPEDTLNRIDLRGQPLLDGPLVFANACTTAQSDAHMTSELEQTFFGRGARAFIGTETKVPTRLASKFAWLYFQFLYRQADPEGKPMAAGEALTQARVFLWTQYRNVGGLFYSMTNQYDLYLASDQEVLSLRR